MVTALWFVVLVGVLVFVHELGHYAWAKAFGVRVMRFSIGFGPRLFGFRRGSTEFRFGIIPLGGYVRMLGESPDDVVAPQDIGTSLTHLSPLRRLIVVLAGPAMNLVFPVLLFFLVALNDTQLSPPIVGTVLAGRPAHGKLQAGDRIVSIDDEAMLTFDDVKRTLASRAGDPVRIRLERDGQEAEVTVSPTNMRRMSDLGVAEDVGAIGILPVAEAPVVGVSSPTGPAAAADLRAFDRITAVAGKPIRKFHELSAALDRNRGALVPITYLRSQPVTGALGGLFDFAIFEPHVTILSPESGTRTGGSATGLERAGLESAELYVRADPEGFERMLGLLPGDRLVAVNEGLVTTHVGFREALAASEGVVELEWRRQGQAQRARVAITETIREALRREPATFVRHWVAPALIDNPRLVRSAVRAGFERTFEMIRATVASFGSLFRGERSLKEVGGPLSIFEMVRVAAQEGTIFYLHLMAFLSIQVGLVNLLPIPLLDGGHVLYLGVETVMRRPIRARTREIAGFVGLAVIALLVVLSFTNDLLRHGPLWWSMFRGP